jgi:hypothetical protein
VVLGVAAAVGLVILLRDSPDPPTAPAILTDLETGADLATGVTPDGEQPGQLAREAPSPVKPAPSLLAEAADLDAHGAIKNFKELNRYPTSSRRLTFDSADLLNPNRRYENRQALPDSEANADRQWEVLFTADRYFVRGLDPLRVSLELWREGREVVPRGVFMTASRLGAHDRVEIPVQKNGAGLSASLVAEEHWPGYVGQISVEARFSAAGLAEQTGSLPFYFTSLERVPAEFTGEFSDRLLNGDLVVDVGLRVDRAGSYRVEGNLFDLAGNPVAWAAFEGDLATGQQAPALKFYGLVFHDAGLSGPFLLQQVRGHRLRPGDSPHREDIADYPAEYHLASHYDFADFTTAEYDSPWKKRMLKFYKEALARGVKLTEPGMPVQTATE